MKIETTNKENIIAINKNVKLEEVILNIVQKGKDIFVVETILYDRNRKIFRKKLHDCNRKKAQWIFVLK